MELGMNIVRLENNTTPESLYSCPRASSNMADMRKRAAGAKLPPIDLGS